MVERPGAAASQPAQRPGLGAPVTPRAEVAAPRARLAGVAQLLRGFWTRLQGLGRLLRILLTRRRGRVSTGVVRSPAASASNSRAHGIAVSIAQPPRAGRGQAARYSVPRVHQDAAAVSAVKTPLARPVLPPPPPPLLVVNGDKVPMKQEYQYKEYYRLILDCPGSCTMCHMCFFDEKRADNGIVRNSRMLLHCSVKHKKPGLECPVTGCYVRVGTDRELELHVHFCHILP